MRVIDDDEISDNAKKFLHRIGIENFEDLANVSSEDAIYRWNNIGRRTFEEILQLMKKHNVSFSDK